jgi:hypothetical protein
MLLNPAAKKPGPPARLKKFARWTVQVTDTFGGEANYAWVRNYEIVTPEPTSQTRVVKRAKEIAGWTGHECKTERIDSDTYIVRPKRLLQIMFIDYKDSYEASV